MVVLSLFDGMSCGQIALHELGIIPETYYASEIDKFAIAQTQLNFPDPPDVPLWRIPPAYKEKLKQCPHFEKQLNKKRI